MTPELVIRSFTTDQYLLDKMVYANFYGLKKFSPDGGNVVVDIGAHCGYFTFAALAMGAKKVYAFEPFLENFRILLKNSTQVLNGQQVFPYQLGVFTSNGGLNVGYPKLNNEGYFDLGSIFPTASREDKEYTMPVFVLDDLIRFFCGNELIDILKFSIGYAELEILSNCSSLNKVQNICGEASLSREYQEQLIKALGAKGFKDNVFKPVEGEPDKTLFYFSKTKVSDVFNIR